MFKIHGLYHFLQQSGRDVRKAAQRVERLRKLAQSAGVPNLLIGTGVANLRNGERETLCAISACRSGSAPVGRSTSQFHLPYA